MSDTQKGMRIALAGNPNCGKTTIFNNITGARQHVGNYPGVTVERVEGKRDFEGEELLFIDLPGTYSLTARSLDELVARNVIINEAPDVLVNVVDASNLERNLYLTAQLVELETPLVLDLNMIDVAESRGYSIDIKKLSTLLRASVATTVGRTNTGTKELLTVVAQVAKERVYTPVKVEYGEEIEKAIELIIAKIDAYASIHYPKRWLAIKLLENDSDVLAKVATFEGGEQINKFAAEQRALLAEKVDLETAFQECRHEFAVRVFNEAVTVVEHVSETTSDKIDKILTNRILGLPIFALIMYVMFNLVFTLGAIPQGWVADGMEALGNLVATGMTDGPLKSLLVDGVIAGVGAVLSFLPLILILFLGISFLEDTGYMARAAFVIDRAMCGVGLHGKSFIPLLLGFGCSVPAVMGSRILDNPRDRLITILSAPFMSCGAKLPVYILLIGAFFPYEWGGTILFGLYSFGILLALISAKIFRSTLLKGEPEPFVMEMPPYHLPTLRSILLHMWERTWLYIKKAGTFIMAASIIVWFLVSYPEDVQYSQDFDSLKAQVETTYQAKDDEIFAKANIAEDTREKVAALVEDMSAKYEEAQEAEGAEEEEAVETESVHDKVKAAQAEDEKAKAEEAEEEVKLPASFAEIEKAEPALYPVAIEIFKNKLAMDDEITKIDEQMAAEKQEQSYAAIFGKTIEPIIEPLGFNWKVGVGLVSSMAAKEILISTLGIIYATEASTDNNEDLQFILANDPSFSPAVALALMAFVLVYPPCIAALAVIKKETSIKWMGFMFVYGNVFAWVVAFIVYHVALALGYGA